jgi:hypothetical protein
VDDEPLDPALQPSWQQILGEVLAAEGAERTAHEVRDSEKSKADSLERLSAEYDYLAQIAAAEDLGAFLERHSPGLAAQLQHSPCLGRNRHCLAPLCSSQSAKHRAHRGKCPQHQWIRQRRGCCHALPAPAVPVRDADC